MTTPTTDLTNQMSAYRFGKKRLYERMYLIIFIIIHLIDTEDILCGLFEVVIQNILHARKLYPETIFELRKFYGIPVYQCIHPEVKEYVTECLKSAKYYISKRRLEKIFVCFDVGEEILEKYTLDIIDFKNTAER